MKRIQLTTSERALATLLLGGVPGCRGIVATGLVSHEEAVCAYEFLDFLARTCEPGDQDAIDCLFLAISIVESEAPEAIYEVALAA